MCKVDQETIERLQLDIKPGDIAHILRQNKKLRLLKNDDVRAWRNYIRIDISPDADSSKSGRTKTNKDPDARPQSEYFIRVQAIKRALPDVPVSGYPGASRAVIKTTDQGINTLLVEGYGLHACMITRGVDGLSTTTNSVIETRQVLGIEAARTAIINEVNTVMGEMDIDPRHIQLLADVMTYRGEVLGITRFGLAKMRDSVLQLASFEKTPDHLFEAAWHGKTDRVEGVSECIIMGQTVGLGTGAMKIVRRLNMAEGEVGRKACFFEDAWRDILG